MRIEEQFVAQHDRLADASRSGSWEIVEPPLPIPAAHAALLPSGKVMFLAGQATGTEYRGPSAFLWSPGAGGTKTWDVPADFSLGSHCLLPDGRLLLIGGDKDQGAKNSKQTYMFDPTMEDWVRLNDIPERGPCTTLVELGDGRILAAGGAVRTSCQVFDKARGWTAASEDLDWPLYPHLTLLADGSVAYSGQHFGGRSLLNPGLLRPGKGFAELPSDATPPGFRFALREQGGTVLLPSAEDQRVMAIAGGSPPNSEVFIANFSNSQPSVRPGESLQSGRANFNTVILPDHTVMVSGGSRHAQSGPVAAMDTEIFDASTGAWIPGAAASVPRPGHSSAVLLPDGRVITAGPAGAGQARPRLEIYHPPYLFRGPRPQAESLPAEIKFGEPFTLATADSDIKWLSLVKPMAASHGFDPGQRLIDLPFESAGRGTLRALAPDNANIAPPGWYLLYLVNHRGTPSIGQWVLLTHAGVPGERPATPGELRGAAGQTGLSAASAAVAPSTPAPWEPVAQSSPFEPPPVPSTGPSQGTLPRSAPAPDPSGPAVTPPGPAVTPSGPAVTPSGPDGFEVRPSPSSRPAASALSIADSPAGWDGAAAWPLPAPQTDFLFSPPQAPPLQDPLPERLFEAPAIVEEAAAEYLVPAPGPKAESTWLKWARPGLVVGSAGLLTASLAFQVTPLRVAAAMLFLLFGPGLAFVGLFRPTGWSSDLALAIGLSMALETILSVALLSLGAWSADRVLLILLAISLPFAALQMVRAVGGRPAASRRSSAA